MPIGAETSQEHSVPLFWPLAAAAHLGSEALAAMQRNLDYALEVGAVQFPAPPEWATPNAVPVVIDAPFAGHSATIAGMDPAPWLSAMTKGT
jgi:hypothetical protein